jgi:hypothetical protein
MPVEKQNSVSHSVRISAQSVAHLCLPPLADLATGVNHALAEPSRQQSLEALPQSWFPHDPLERYDDPVAASASL